MSEDKGKGNTLLATEEKSKISILLYQLLQSPSMPSNHKVKYSTTFSITDKDYNKVTTLIEITALSRLKYTQSAEYKEIFKFLHNIIEEQDIDTKKIFLKFLKSISFQYRLKQKIKTISGLELVKYQGVESGIIIPDQKFRPKLGELTLVQFWASWSGYCRTSIKENLQILDEYDNIQYVLISLDDEKDEHYEGMKYLLSLQSNALQILHYRFQEGWDNLNVVIRGLQIEGLPFILLVDEQQRISYMGHPKELMKYLKELTKDKSKYSKKQSIQQDEFQEQIQEKHKEQNQLSKIVQPPNQSEILFQLNQNSNIQQLDQNIGQINLIKQSLIKSKKNKQDESDSEDDQVYNNFDENDNGDTPSLEVTDEIFKYIKALFINHLQEILKNTISSKGLEFSLKEVNVHWKVNNQEKPNGFKLQRTKLHIKNQLPQKEMENMKTIEQAINSLFQIEKIKGVSYQDLVSTTGDFIDDKKQIIYKINDLFESETRLPDNFHYISDLRITEDRKYVKNCELVALQPPEIQQVINCKQEFDYFIADFDEDAQQYGQDIFKQIIQVCALKPGMKFIAITDYVDEEGQGTISKSDTHPTLIYYFNKDLTDYLEHLIALNDQIGKDSQYKIHAINKTSKEEKNEDTINFNNSAIQVYYPKNNENNPYQYDHFAYGYTDCPYYIVVDKKGIILKNGRITSDSDYWELFQQNITILPELSPITYHDFDPLKLVDQICKNQRFVESPKFRIKFKIKEQKSLMNKKQYSLVKVKYTICDYLKLDLIEFLKTFQYIEILSEKCKIYTTFSIKNLEQQEQYCMEDDCGNLIPADTPLYYSKKKEKYICCACAEKLDVSSEGSKKFLSTDTLIYINAPLSDVKILSNIVEEQGYYWNDCFGCQGTENNDISVTYDCITCRPVYFCQTCFKKLSERKSKEYLAIIEKNRRLGMTEDFLLQREIDR